MVMEIIRRFLVTLMQPEGTKDKVRPAVSPALVQDLFLLMMPDGLAEPQGTGTPLHEATLFVTLPDLALLSPEQALAFREALAWEIEVLTQAYEALDPELEGLAWRGVPVD